MHSVAIALNVLFAAIVLITIVGGLFWAILTSRGGRHLAAATRTQAVVPRRADPGAPRQPGSRDRGPAVAV